MSMPPPAWVASSCRLARNVVDIVWQPSDYRGELANRQDFVEGRLVPVHRLGSPGSDLKRICDRLLVPDILLGLLPILTFASE